MKSDLFVSVFLNSIASGVVLHLRDVVGVVTWIHEFGHRPYEHG